MDLLYNIKKQLSNSIENRDNTLSNLDNILNNAMRKYGMNVFHNKDKIKEVKEYFEEHLNYLWPLLSKTAEPKYIYSLFNDCIFGNYKYGYNDPYNISLNMLLINIKKTNRYKNKLFYFNRLKIKSQLDKEKWMGMEYSIKNTLEIESRKLIFIRYIIGHFPIIDDLKLKILKN